MDILKSTFSIINPLRLKSFYNEEQIKVMSCVMEAMFSELNQLILPVELSGLLHKAHFNTTIITPKKTILDWLSCSIQIEIDLSKYAKLYNEEILSKIKEFVVDVITFCKDEVIDDFNKLVKEFCIAFNIAYPGFFEIDNIQIYLNDQTIKQNKDNMICGLTDTYLFALQNKWPVISLLNIADVWKWLAEKTNYFHGTSKIAIDRALNAFTYIFNNTGYEDLLYSLIGIESIYNTNQKNGILEQIRAKCELLFGTSPTYKKSLNNMYDIRSRYIHGQLNFPAKFNINDGTKEFEKFLDNYSDTLSTAKSVLLATIQFFIMNNASELNTEIVLHFQ